MCIMSLFDSCGGGDSITKVMMAYGVSDRSALPTLYKKLPFAKKQKKEKKTQRSTRSAVM